MFKTQKVRRHEGTNVQIGESIAASPAARSCAMGKSLTAKIIHDRAETLYFHPTLGCLSNAMATISQTMTVRGKKNRVTIAMKRYSEN